MNNEVRGIILKLITNIQETVNYVGDPGSRTQVGVRAAYVPIVSPQYYIVGYREKYVTAQGDRVNGMVVGALILLIGISLVS